MDSSVEFVAVDNPHATRLTLQSSHERQIRRAQEPTPRTFPISPRTLGEITMDIQRELARRGFYDGSVNGLYGPKTHAAIRDFEHAVGLKPSIQPNEALLQAILRFPAKADKSSR